MKRFECRIKITIFVKVATLKKNSRVGSLFIIILFGIHFTPWYAYTEQVFNRFWYNVESYTCLAYTEFCFSMLKMTLGTKLSTNCFACILPPKPLSAILSPISNFYFVSNIFLAVPHQPAPVATHHCVLAFYIVTYIKNS